MKDALFETYTHVLSGAIANIESTRRDMKPVPLKVAIKNTIGYISQAKRSKKKVIFVGNGGSSAIASHQAVDYWKNGHIKATAFNDSALLTCVSNDYGYDKVFQKPIERFAEKGDVVFAISSSGQSRNIINAVRSARQKGVYIITLSGFSGKNSLRRHGDINFYVPSRSYGIVEIAHLLIAHSMLDHIIENRL
ncbi:MAG: SIS domain-containing protein [Candidatus Omnitrophica bacterium]|nr:SIS domain-containing protein [Candidatus Omnitrophota bacterium]